MTCCLSLGRLVRPFLILILLALPLAFVSLDHADDKTSPVRLELSKGDRVAIIGNTTADRLQHDGWLETYLHSRYPKHDLSFRNLGFSGDEIGGYVDSPRFHSRLRSASFGSGDEWLTRVKADVIFAFFGYNESYRDKAGLEQFIKDLTSFITHARSQKYNGTSAPRIVLFSPIAHEDLKSPNLPDGKANNVRLALYVEAMAKVARDNKVTFVDLFAATKDLYASAKKPLTFNGVHLTEEGNRELAKAIDGLFEGKPEGQRDEKSLALVRKAVLDRNFHWFHRYRTTDGFSVYGGRSGLKFEEHDPKTGKKTGKINSNYEVAQREMKILDVMTANRDRVVWAAAQGNSITPDDSNTPDFVTIHTKLHGPLPGGKHVFLDPEKAIDKMTIGKNFQVNLFASEKKFPEFVNPVQMSWDTKGRLWVAVWPTYPHWKPKEPMNDKILILEDTDGDGVADTCKTFADGLHCPTGFEFYNGGVLVANCPDLLFLKASDGGDKADVRKRVLGGLDSADTHHASNSFALDPGGALYFQEGTFHHSQVETPYGPPVRQKNATVFRYEPRTQKFGIYVGYDFANPHGHVFDRWGRDIVVDGTGAQPYDAALFSGHLEFPDKHDQPPTVWKPPSRPCPGMEVLSSRHFPPEMQGDVLVPNVIGQQGIFQMKLSDDGASFQGKRGTDVLMSSDLNFRPSDVKIGPDGAIYFIDWHNPIIGHMQYNLRDPNRDREHGRVYRVTYKGRDLLTPAKIHGEPIEKLLELLKEPEDRTRYRTRIELGGRPTKDVIAAAKKWIANLDKKDEQYEHNLLEALWLHQSHNVVDEALLKQLLTTKDHRARSAATRVLCYWRDRVTDPIGLLRKQAADEHPRVRLEAVRAASFFDDPSAIEILLVADEKQKDRYLNFVRTETLRALNPVITEAVASGKKITFHTPAGERYFIKVIRLEDLLKLKRTTPVNNEILFRAGVRDEVRREVLTTLAKEEKKSESRMLLDAIARHDADPASQDETIAFDLIRLLSGKADELKGLRADLLKLATSARQPIIRQLGYVALVTSDGDTAKAYEQSLKSATSLLDFVEAVPMLGDAGQRAGLYDKVVKLLDGLPKELDSGKEAKGPRGRFVRIELPGKMRTLTLAEVEVYSGGVNVARRGKATQMTTAYGGNASRGIDGNTSGRYGDNGQTHSQEGTQNPWWEVDLGAEYAIESVVIYNRTDGNFGDRLRNFTLKISDERRVTYEKQKNPPPSPKTTFVLGKQSAERAVRVAAMRALTTMRGHEADAVKAMAKFMKEAGDRDAAVQALARIPARQWPAEQVKAVLDDVTGYVSKVPVKERTQPAVVDALQLADSLAGTLPLEEARKVRKQLGELGVRVVRIGTLVEQMLYDRERIVVQAGKPIEILFENTDTMPHNLVFLEPGALEEVGELAEKTGNSPDAAKREYVPESKKVLQKSRLLQPRQSERIAWTAPAKAGVYPYVCTYPGHWRRMHGAMYVVDDLEAYQADPEGYLAKKPLKISDELLKFNRPRKEWKLEELASGVKELTGRSFATGKQMFTVAACVSCHKFGGQGQEFGPDLTKMDVKWTAEDVVKHVLDPSQKIDDQYRNWTFELDNGKSVTGMILKETKEEVQLIENPLLKDAKPIIVKVARIDKRKKSDVSPMPKGLLDKLTREEVLDLIAYVVSKADPKHKAFMGGGHEHEHKH